MKKLNLKVQYLIMILMVIGFSNQTIFAAQNVPQNLGRDVQPTVPVKAVSLSAQPKINIEYAVHYAAIQVNPPPRPPRPKTANVTFHSLVSLSEPVPARGSVVIQYYDNRTRLARLVMSPDPKNDQMFRSEYELKNYPLKPNSRFHAIVTVYNRDGGAIAVHDGAVAFLE